MKKVLLIFVAMVTTLLSYSQEADAVSGATQTYKPDGNSLYHRTEETRLKIGELWVEGEVQNPGRINLEKLYKRDVFYKEAIPDDSGKINFIGANRYVGYSLFDLLNGFIIEKKNTDTFRPATDLFIVIENDQNEEVTFSWAEIFYTNIPHQVIIATESAPIEPYKCKVNYPTGNTWKLVAANDLYGYRMLENPVKITVKSFDKKDYTINRNLRNTFSPKVDVVVDDKLVMIIDSNSQFPTPQEKYKSVFYGMGQGYHPIPEFNGVELGPLIEKIMNKNTASWMSNGLVCFSGLDGYRVIYSYSELFNRVDQVQAILATENKSGESGYFRIYHPDCFYGDMSVKCLAEIFLFKE